MSPGVKRAALALHGLAQGDRAWILGRIPESERALLDRLLVELKELGIPAEPIAMPTPTPTDRVAKAKGARMASILRDEPDGIIAGCLAIRDWPWSATVLARLPRRRRDRVLALTGERKQSGAAAALEAALVAELDSRLATTRRWRFMP